VIMTPVGSDATELLRSRGIAVVEVDRGSRPSRATPS